MNGHEVKSTSTTRKRKLSVTCLDSSHKQGSCAKSASNSCTKIETMITLGLEETAAPSAKRRIAPSSYSSSNLNESQPRTTAGNSKNVDALIEKFVSTLNSAITESENKKIISRFFDLREKCKDKYIHSKEFHFLISSALERIQKDPSRLFVHIKDVYDEMKLHRLKKTSTAGANEVAASEQESPDDKNKQEIRRLEKLLEKLHSTIDKLKEKEVTLDEMDNKYSAYIYEDKLTKRLMQVWKKLSKLKQQSSGLDRNTNKRFRYNASKYAELNSKVESFVNTSRDFPDFSDILQVTGSVNESASLGLSDSGVQFLAQQVFQDVGRDLKKQRISEYQDLLCSYETYNADAERDPAESDSTLRETLEQNYREGQDKFQKVLNEFAEKQVALKLEPKQVEDKYVKEQVDSDSDDDEEDRAIEQEQMEEEMCSDDIDDDKVNCEEDK